MSKRSQHDARSPVLKALSISRLYLDYEQAFTRATGLSLNLCAPESLLLLQLGKKGENPLCELASKTTRVCAQCYALQQQLEREANLKPKTLRCFAGMCETAVPVRLGDNLIAFLRTGGVLLAQPSQARFNRIARTVVQWGAELDLKAFEMVEMCKTMGAEDCRMMMREMVKNKAMHKVMIEELSKDPAFNDAYRQQLKDGAHGGG